MVRKQLLALSGIVGFVIWCAAPASGENLVYNGSFESNLQGYTLAAVPIGVSPKDAAAATDSGSALIVNNYFGKNVGQGIHQCLYGVTFTAGSSFALGGKILLPTGQTNTGWAAIGLNWFTDSICQVSHATSGPRAELRTPASTFQSVVQTFAPPSGAVSAMLVAYVTKAEDGGSLLAFMDDLHVVPIATTPNSTQLWVPTAAHIAGAGGSAWRTDLEIANPGSASVSYVIELLKKNQANPTPQRKTFTLNAGLTIRYPDLVLAQLGFEGSGALRITPTGGRLVATSRTYNQTATGTYGQFVPGLPEDQAIIHGSQGRLIQLSQSATTTTGYRTNVGFVNGTNMPIHVEVKLYSSTGAALGTLGYDLKAYEYQQDDKIFTKVPAASVVDGFAVLKTTTTGGRFFAYASVIDNVTGDPVCVQVARR